MHREMVDVDALEKETNIMCAMSFAPSVPDEVADNFKRRQIFASGRANDPPANYLKDLLQAHKKRRRMAAEEAPKV